MCRVYVVTKVHMVLTYMRGAELWVRKGKSFSLLSEVISQLLSLQMLERCLCASVGKPCQSVS